MQRRLEVRLFFSLKWRIWRGGRNVCSLHMGLRIWALEEGYDAQSLSSGSHRHPTHANIWHGVGTFHLFPWNLGLFLFLFISNCYGHDDDPVCWRALQLEKTENESKASTVQLFSGFYILPSLRRRPCS